VFLKSILIVLFSSIVFVDNAWSQMPTSPLSGKADSLFFAGNWRSAGKEYERLLKSGENNNSVLLLNRLGFCYQNMHDFNKALAYYKKAEMNNPASGMMKQTLYARMAKSYAAIMDFENSLSALKKAVDAGFVNFEELDTALPYAKFRKRIEFATLRDTMYYRAFPCMTNPHAREFDFWVGEWIVFATGTKTLQGRSSIQRVSGGCLILENWTSANYPYNGKSMNFLDSTGKWQQVWVGASETRGPNIFVNGRYEDNAMRFDFIAQDQNARYVKGRFTFFNQGPNQVRQLQETSADDGKTWQTVYDFTYIRKK